MFSGPRRELSGLWLGRIRPGALDQVLTWTNLDLCLEKTVGRVEIYSAVDPSAVRSTVQYSTVQYMISPFSYRTAALPKSLC